MPDPQPVQLVHLAPRELEVLQLLAKGMTNRLIAERPVLGEATVENHVARVAMAPPERSGDK